MGWDNQRYRKTNGEFGGVLRAANLITPFPLGIFTIRSVWEFDGPGLRGVVLSPSDMTTPGVVGVAVATQPRLGPFPFEFAVLPDHP